MSLPKHYSPQKIKTEKILSQLHQPTATNSTDPQLLSPLHFFSLSSTLSFSFSFPASKQMSPVMGKCQKIRHIVQIRQMLRRWRRKAHITAARATPSDVPAGHVAICVGASCRRFIVRATHLNHPIFKRLLVQAEEEYGFSNVGPLTIPCDESLFEEILLAVSRSDSLNSGRFFTLEDPQRCGHVGMKNSLEFFNESGHLLHGLADKSVC